MHVLKLKIHFLETPKDGDSQQKKFMQLCRVERILVAFSGDHFLRFFSYFLHFWRKTDNHPKSLRKPRGKFEKQKFWNFFFENFFENRYWNSVSLGFAQYIWTTSVLNINIIDAICMTPLPGEIWSRKSPIFSNSDHFLRKLCINPIWSQYGTTKFRQAQEVLTINIEAC